eukprot:tig00000852_g5029.t1
MQHSSWLLDLPEGILEKILQLVGLTGAWTARRTCRRLRDAVEGGVAWRGELRSVGTADDPAALERLAALAMRDEVLQLFGAAAGVVEACAAAAAPAAGGAESFEAALTVDDNLLTVDTLREALGGAPPGLHRLTGLHLPPELHTRDDAAREIAARCPRLRRLSFGVDLVGQWGKRNADLVLRQLSALPLEDLAIRCPGSSTKGSYLKSLVGTPAGTSLRSLELGEKIRLDRYNPEGTAALFSFPRLERVASKLFVSLEEAPKLWSGLEQQGPLREARLILDHTTWGSYLSRLGEAVRRSSLATLHLEFESDVTAPPGGFLPPLLEGAGAVLRSLALTVKEPPAAGDLAALAARGPPLESVLLSLPFSCYQGDLPPGDEVLAALAPLGARLEVRLLREKVSLRETAEHVEQGRTLGSLRRLLPSSRVELLGP